MGYVRDVINAQREVNAARRGDQDADMDRDRAVDIAKGRRAVTIAGHGAQPGTPGHSKRR